jgi:hypothetical protein
MVKIVYNTCYGGFSLSLEGQKRYLELKGYEPIFRDGPMPWQKHWYAVDWGNFSSRDIDRSDPVLVQIVEELGAAANGDCAELAIAEVSTGMPYRIDEYHGFESVMTYDDYDWKPA